MKIISFIQDEQLVKKMLKHLHLFDVKRKTDLRANSPPAGALIIYNQSSSPSADDFIFDADYPIETLPIEKSRTGQNGEPARI